MRSNDSATEALLRDADRVTHGWSGRVQVLNGREKSDIGQETSSYRQNELLLSSLCYKSEDDYNKFLTALDKTDQGHVRNTITGRTGEKRRLSCVAEYRIWIRGS